MIKIALSKPYLYGPDFNEDLNRGQISIHGDNLVAFENKLKDI